MKCSHCGAEMAVGSKYCIQCGAKVAFVFTEELIRSAQAGNQTAIAELYHQTYNSVYQAIRLIIKNDDDAALDIVQDTYIRGFQYLEQLDKPENFKAWIKRIGVNTAKNYLKKKKPVLFSELNPEEDEEAPILQFEDERIDHLPEVQMDRNETSRLIAEILDSLSDEQRIALTMFYYNELSVREIAEELGCSENTVKSRLNYGRQKVKVKVEELAKKGTKLYSLAPLPFFVFLLRTQEAQAATLPGAYMLDDSKVLRAIQKSCTGARGAGKTVTMGTRTAAKEGTKAALKAGIKAGGKAVSSKIVAGIVAGTLVVGAAVGVPIAISSNQNRPAVVELPVPENERPEREEIPVEEPLSVDELMEDDQDGSSMESSENSYSELIDTIHHVIMLGVDGSYDTRPDQIEEMYSDLGEGIVWLLTHREVDVYTIDIYYREYDVDGDGEDELLLGRGVSPSRIEVIAMYETNGDPTVGDALYGYSFPTEYEPVPLWNWINDQDY